MALSFGRKKGEDAAANTASNGNGQKPATNTPGETFDDSWFETASDAGAATPAAAIPSAYASSAPSTDADFTVFDNQNKPAEDDFSDFGDFGANTTPAASAPAAPASSLNTGAFVDPAFGDSGGTPFDTTTSAATDTGAEAPAKKGGLKKLLPILAVLLIVGGGGAFWMSQQAGSTDDEGTVTLPAATTPDGAVAPVPPSSQPIPPLPAGGRPPAGAPAPGGAPGAPLPPSAPPAGAQPDAVKARLKKMWDEGLALRKQNKMADARAKWTAAVKLARSKPQYAKSADMIQSAINKLK